MPNTPTPVELLRRRNHKLVLVGAPCVLRPLSLDRTSPCGTGPFPASTNNFDAAAGAIALGVQVEAVLTEFTEGAIDICAGISLRRQIRKTGEITEDETGFGPVNG